VETLGLLHASLRIERPLTCCFRHDAKRAGSGEDAGALILVSRGMAATRWLTAAVGGGAVLYVFDYDHVL
jgi:hypothetical protein